VEIEVGGLGVSEARRLKSLEDENRRLKRPLAESLLDNAALKDQLEKSERRAQAGWTGSFDAGLPVQTPGRPSAAATACASRPRNDAASGIVGCAGGSKAKATS
jgi:hypothetical protein